MLEHPFYHKPLEPLFWHNEEREIIALRLMAAAFRSLISPVTLRVTGPCDPQRGYKHVSLAGSARLPLHHVNLRGQR